MKLLKYHHLVVFGLLILLSSNLKSQNLKNQWVMQTNLGYSFSTNILNAGIKIGTPVNAKISPVTILSVDYGIQNNFSLGAAFCRQTIDATLENYDYFNTNLDSLIIENIKFSLNRSHFSVLPKFHFLPENEKFDVYAGFRLGYVHWKTKFETTDPNFSKNVKYFTGRPSIGLITGMRLYLIKGFGTNIEINIGAPYVVSAGLTFRFGGGELE